MNMKKWICSWRTAGKDSNKAQVKMGANLSHRKGVLDPSSLRSFQHQQRVTPLEDSSVDSVVRPVEERTDLDLEETEDLSISFGYQCRKQQRPPDSEEGSNLSTSSRTLESVAEAPSIIKLLSQKSRSFSCLCGAALSANATLANTSLCNGLIGEEILPGLDSPRTFRKLVSSNSSTKLELFRLSPASETTSPTGPPLSTVQQSCSAPTPVESGSGSFLNADDVQMAGGAAGEDRVQAVCSEENGWLFCGIYDGFNGRDAADFLAGTFYENLGLHLRLLEWHVQLKHQISAPSLFGSSCPNLQDGSDSYGGLANMDISTPEEREEVSAGTDISGERECSVDEIFQQGVMRGLEGAFEQTEREFLEMVEQEMDDRPELVMAGSCVLAVLMHGQDLYTLNVGDSRAVLATTHPPENSFHYGRVDGSSLWAVQMTESHVVDNRDERNRVLAEHPDDAMAISGGRLKGKLKVTRAFGAGYLKKAKLNDALVGILRVRNLFSPPYLGVVPCVSAHRMSAQDSFVVLGSDGLFDFFTNEEVVNLVHNFVRECSKKGDPAKYLLEQLLLRAAENAEMTVDQLKGIPIGRRRKYHDDVTVIVISLGAEFPTSTASTG